MADKNNKEFQWNFNLDDADSDFTDIDFSSTSFEPSEKDIQPIIFVRDETRKKKTETEKAPQNAAPAHQAAKKPAAARRPAASVKKPAAKKKKASKGIELNWRLIAVIAAAVLIVALIVLLLSMCGKGNKEKAWTKVEADSKVKTVIDNYFQAKKEGDAQAMRKVLVADSVVNASVLSLEAGIYKDYTDIELQEYPGIGKNETVVCATYDTVLNLIPASVPTISWFYVLPDEKGDLRLMTVTEMEAPENKSINDYAAAAAGLLEKTTVAEAQARFNTAVSSNSMLAQYLQNIKDGRYYDVPSESESENQTQNQTEPQTTEEVKPVEAGTFVYVNAGTLNMRSGPTTNEDNVIWRFTRGWCVTVIGETGEWYKIRDEV